MKKHLTSALFLKRFIPALFLLTFACASAPAQATGADARSAIKRGNERYARGEYEAAIREYGQVARARGDVYAQALYNTGVCYFELERTDEAIEMYRRAIEMREGLYPKALYALGVALESAKRLEEAKEAYRRAIDASAGGYTEARLAVAHYRLALLVGYGGDYEAAAALFRESLSRSKGEFPTAHNNLGVMLAFKGCMAEAEREFELALHQANMDFEEAAHNLKLCRALLSKNAQADKTQLNFASATFKLALNVNGG
jgi:tetratricopeptide (TPR) repeat protein